MIVTKKSQITGLINSMDLDLTQEQLNRVENRFHTKELIQNIVPNLSSAEREFLITGITPTQWGELFGIVESN